MHGTLLQPLGSRKTLSLALPAVVWPLTWSIMDGLVDKSSLVAEQGHLIGRPGLVYIDLEKESDEIRTVKVGGSAVTVMNGELFF